jgi:hypothetical protein
MNENLHPALVEAYAIAPAQVAHIYTLELRHDAMSEPLYLVQGYFHKELKISPTGDFIKFRACAFNFTLPATDEGGLQELTLVLDNTNNQVSDFCESAMNFPAPVEIYFRPYLSTDPENPLMDPPLRLFLKDVQVSEAQVTGRAAPADFLNLKFPTEIYSSPRFPPLS